VSRPHALRVRCGIDAVHGGISLAASRNLFEPVQDFLNLLAWDRVKRLRKFGPTYLSTEDTPYIAAAIQCFFIGSVARAFVPGCQLDTMLILEGDQGLRKTSALRTLAGPDWFSCSPIIIGREPDCYQKLDGVWIYELGEVDGQLKHEQRQQELKGYMTSREDNYRPSYGRNAIRRLRRNSFVGSTNEHKYLADPTGARRYHGVPCGVVKVDEIARDRSQLWAEAVCMYRDGKPWWLDGQLEKDAAAIADLRYLDDPWEERLPLVLAEREVTTTAEMLYLLGVDPGKFDRATATKAGIALRRAGGWRRVEGPPPTGGSARYHYVRIHGKYV
jgi:putative DNA primase/helicase